MWDEVEEKLVGKNVYFDTAFSFEEVPPHMNKEQFIEWSETMADKIVFATDSPWSGQLEAIQNIKAMGFDEITERMILGENAKKLLGLSRNVIITLIHLIIEWDNLYLIFMKCNGLDEYLYMF